MPRSSRKKSQGKIRKAIRAAEASSASCNHGLPSNIPQSCVDFMHTFHGELYKAVDQEQAQPTTPLKAVMLAMDVTRVQNTAVWQDTNLRDIVKACFVSMATDQVLKKQQKHFDFAGKRSVSSCCSALLLLKPQHPFIPTAALAVGVLRLDDEETTSTWSILDCPKGRNKIRDMVLSSSQSTTKFFAKLTPCNCLNDMAKEVKAQAKMGQCIHCDETKERREMFLCGRFLVLECNC